MIQYDYTKDPVMADRLIKEIQAAALAIALDHMNVYGSQLSIFYPNSLSDADKTSLDAVISAHDGNPTAEEAWLAAALAAFEKASDFSKLIVSNLQATCDYYDFSAEQRAWLQARMRAVTITMSNGDTIVMDMLNLVISGEAKAAYFAAQQITPDDMTKPYHCFTQELVDGMIGMLYGYLNP